jgi:hypothetical protein
MITDADRRPIQTAAIFTPEVIGIENGWLIWDANSTGKHRPTGALLGRFLELADADDDSVYTFAKRWGALNIDAQAARGLRFREAISTWRRLASRIGAIYRLGIEVNLERRGTDQDWETLGVDSKNFPDSLAGSLREARFALMKQVGRLVAEAHLQPRLYWDNKREQWQIDFDSEGRSNLLAIIVIQLMVEVARNDGYAICSDCKRTYIPKRQPSPGRKNYCDRKECKQAAWRNSKRSLRRKGRETGQ